MAELIIVAVIWFVVSSLVKAMQQKRVQDEKARRVTPAAPVPRPNIWEQVAEIMDVGDEGESPSGVDEQGCIGGSIEHGAHEGDYAPGSLTWVPTVEYQPVEFGGHVPAPRVERKRLSHAHMRRAVILSEVLDRPVALR